MVWCVCVCVHLNILDFLFNLTYKQNEMCSVVCVVCVCVCVCVCAYIKHCAVSKLIIH